MIMIIHIRKEVPADYRVVEEVVRDAFWGAMNHPTCDGEHLLVHKLRNMPVCIPELDLVAEVGGRIVGHVIYSTAQIVTDEGKSIEVLTFGPFSVHPDYKRTGVGSALMHHSIEEAVRLGYRAILFYGHPDYYPRFGFHRASEYGITNPNRRSFDALMAMELYDGALEGITGKFYESDVFDIDPRELDEFEKNFPAKAPARLLPIEALSDQLPEAARGIFRKHGYSKVSALQDISGVEMLRWEGMDEVLLRRVNEILEQLGYTRKLLPDSYILQLVAMNVRNPICSLIRSKAGISVYRVESEGRHMVLKVFDRIEDTREITNYQLLAERGIQTLPVFGVTKNAILLPDVDDDPKYRLGVEEDMRDPEVARAIAKWYKKLHAASIPTAPMYDESDVITLENMQKVATVTDTVSDELWKVYADHYEQIRNGIGALPRVLTYNDFYYTNLIVARDKSEAFMFDYNLLGKGMPYGDVRNVTSSLSEEAAAVFVNEYGMKGLEEQALADAWIAPLVTLYLACGQETFPAWAEESLKRLRNGEILKYLREWMETKL